MCKRLCGVLLVLCGVHAAPDAAAQAAGTMDSAGIAEIAELSPAAARVRQQQGAFLVDVREEDERAQGFAAGALGVPLAELIADPARHLPDRNADILLICRSGQRSRRAAASLIRQGYTRVVSVAGGTLRWDADGLPMTYPQAATP